MVGTGKCSSTSTRAENNTLPLWPPKREMVEEKLTPPHSQYLVLQRKESSAVRSGVRSGGEGGCTQVSVQQKSTKTYCFLTLTNQKQKKKTLLIAINQHAPVVQAAQACTYLLVPCYQTNGSVMSNWTIRANVQLVHATCHIHDTSGVGTPVIFCIGSNISRG